MPSADLDPTPLPLHFGTRMARACDVTFRRPQTLDTLRDDWNWGGAAAPLIHALRAAGDDVEADRVLRISLADPRTPDRRVLTSLLA